MDWTTGNLVPTFGSGRDRAAESGLRARWGKNFWVPQKGRTGQKSLQEMGKTDSQLQSDLALVLKG
jgi:hypothetical protein